MEEKGKEKEGLLRLKAQLRREELEFRKEQLLVRISKARKGRQAGVFLFEREISWPY